MMKIITIVMRAHNGCVGRGIRVSQLYDNNNNNNNIITL